MAETTNSVELIGTAPDGDSVNGHFVEAITPAGAYIPVYTESGMVVETLSFEGINFSCIETFSQHIGHKVRFSQGIKFGQGIEFYKNGDIYKSGGGNSFFGNVW